MLNCAVGELVQTILHQSDKTVDLSNTNIPSLIKRQSAHKHVVEELKNSGIQVEMVEPSFQKFVLVDTSEVWFGNVSILGDVLSVERDGLINKRSEERGMLHIFNKNV